jgi:hypothetical protein
MGRFGQPIILALVALAAVALLQPSTALAASAEQIDRDARKRTGIILMPVARLMAIYSSPGILLGFQTHFWPAYLQRI